jgi:chaperone required for assembly of F1-ATPase
MPTSRSKERLKSTQEILKKESATPINPTPNSPQPTPINPVPIPNSPQAISSFIPSEYIANDLFSDSSNLPQTSKSDADKAIKAISEKRETLRIIGANLQLNTDVYKVGSLNEKMNQAAISYQIDGINSQSKMVALEGANINLQIAESKLHQTQEKLNHQNIELSGLQAETPLRQRYWEAKLSLIESRISQVELAKFTLDSKIGAIEAEAENID